VTNQPSHSDFPSEIDFARAMQRWALQEVPTDNPQRLICINDWFAEEILIGISSGSEVVGPQWSAVCASSVSKER